MLIADIRMALRALDMLERYVGNNHHEELDWVVELLTSDIQWLRRLLEAEAKRVTSPLLELVDGAEIESIGE